MEEGRKGRKGGREGGVEGEGGERIVDAVNRVMK